MNDFFVRAYLKNKFIRVKKSYNSRNYFGNQNTGALAWWLEMNHILKTNLNLVNGIN